MEVLRRRWRELMRNQRMRSVVTGAHWPPYVSTLAVTLLMALATALVVAQTFLPNRLSLRPGDVATQNVTAPKAVRFESQTKTEEARAVAAKQVADQFDATITVQQREALDALGRKVSDLRQSPDPQPERLARLAVFEPQLTDAQRQYLLQSDDATVAAIFRGAGDIFQSLESNGIKAETLRAAQDTAVARAAAIRPDRTGQQLVGQLVHDYLKVNFQPQQTAVMRQQARDAVPPVLITVARGETIIRYGDQVTPFQLEEAQAVGLLAPTTDWYRILASFVLVIVLFALALGYLMQFKPAILHEPRQLLLLGVLVLAELLLAKAILPIDPRAQYVIPMAVVPLLISALLDPGLGIIVAFGVGLLTGVMGDNVLELTLVGFLGGAIGAIFVSRLERLGQWFAAGILVAGAQFVTLVSLGLIERHTGLDEVLRLGFVVSIGGLLSAVIAAGLVMFLGEAFGVLTPLKLLELMTPTNPLLKQLMVSAPGTYNHSMVAASLAESAAEAVGASPLIVRVGCYFHDIGKIRRPHFFVENQAEMGNIHENLSPTTSSDILNAHVTDGVELLNQYKFPGLVKDIVRQHQGTTVKKYFYRQALQQGLEVREDDFRYPGPRPRTKEAAIVMMADTVEASTRTLKEYTIEGIRAHVHRMIQGFVRDGQLDECDLSFSDISRIEEAFANMVVSIHHTRIEYPAAAGAEAVAGAAGAVPVDIIGGGHDGTLDVDEKTIPLPASRTRDRQ